jgi:hypothetical protein
MKAILCGLLTLLCAAAATTQPQQDEMMVGSATRKMKSTLAESQRDASVVYLRLMADLDKAQRNSQAQQEQARIDLAAKMALATSRLAKGSEADGIELRKTFATGLSQAGQTFSQRMSEIDAEQNQAIAQAVQRFAQQKGELLNSHPKEVVATIARLTQDLAAADMGKTVSPFTVSLPPFAQPADAADAGLEEAYRADTDAARKAYAEGMSEARAKVLTTIQQSLEAAPNAPSEEQATEIKNTIRRFGLWAADSMDTYQIALKSALRKYQLGESRPQAQADPQAAAAKKP